MNKKQQTILASTFLLIAVAGGVWYYFKKPKNTSLPLSNDNSSSDENLTSKNTVNPIMPTPKSKAVFTKDAGYQISEDGLITQFGYGGRNVVFPIPFPNKCYAVIPTTVRNSPGSRGFNHVTSVTNKGFSSIIDGNNGYWVAYGN